ncbi:MAG: IclR family transcriptional regulator [Mesorhizobium sp.]
MDKAFVKALSLIEALAYSDESRGVTSLASELSLTKSNVHRLLSTLERHGYVQRVAINSTYELSPKIWELGARVMEKYDLPRIARPAMEQLAAATGETVHLSILDRYDVLYIDKIDSEHPVRAYTRVGGRAPAWCVATGKAMLAFQPEDMIAGLEPLLTPSSKHTIIDLSALRENFDQIRKTGVAFNNGEWREDVNGIAAPIYDQRGQVKAAIGVSGPSSRLVKKVMQKFAADVDLAAKRISSDPSMSRP